MKKSVLFLCTGNYYRSRFAEILFNSVAGKMVTPLPRRPAVSLPTFTVTGFLAGSFEAIEQQMLLGMLDSQIVGITVKARAIQKGLLCLLAAIAAFLLCSLFAGATVLHEWVGMVALGMGFLGLSLFLVGLGWAMRELTLSLSPLEEETAYLNVLTSHHLAKSQGGKRLKVAESA